jgi:tRNA dimethylallyltransferase
MSNPARPKSKQLIVAVLGPTASGKSALALRLAQALDGEIVGCDALQVRAGLPILTAKPTAADLAQCPHHLIGVLPLERAATAAHYARLADDVIAELERRGRPVILCGGTGLYLRALCDGLFDGPPADRTLREGLRAEAEQQGVAALHRRLGSIDPAAAARIAPADYVRIERALEVHALTGRPLSDWLAAHQAERAAGPRHRTLRIALDPGTDALRARIDARLQRMFDDGLLDEVAAVKARGPLRDPPLGYDLVAQHLDGEISREAMCTAFSQRTWQYARRQRTWFRGEPAVTWYPDADAVPVAELVSTVRAARSTRAA